MRDRKKYILLISILIIIMSFLNTFYIPLAEAGPADEFGYCKVLGITNANNSYPIMLNVTKTSGGDVNCSGHCQDDFDDVRFYDVDNTTRLDYWIERYTSGSYAWMWVELPSDIETDQKMIMWYGNSTASDLSNGTATFTFFDDFDGVVTDLWGGDTGSAYLDSSICYFNATNSIKWLYSKTSYSGDIMIEYYAKFGLGSNKFMELQGSDTQGSRDVYTLIGNANYGTLTIMGRQDDGPTTENTAAHGHPAWEPTGDSSNFHIYGMGRLSGSKIDYYMNYTFKSYLDGGVPSDDFYPQLRVGSNDAGVTATIAVDWARVRPYLATEPSVSSAGAELDNTPPELNNLSDAPDPLECCGYVNITCDVTDEVSAINSVKVNITGPVGFSDVNTSMTNDGGDTYYYNTSYSILGIYTYFVWAEDTEGNDNCTSTSTFTLQDTTPPWIEDVEDHPHWNYTDGYINITCNVTDNCTSVDTVKVNITYPDLSTHNETMTADGGNIYFRYDNYSAAGLYEYFIWANDTEGNDIVSAPYPLYNFTIAAHQDTVYVDDDYTPATPGWNTTHYDNIPDAITILNPDGTIYVYEGDYSQAVIIDRPLSMIGNTTMWSNISRNGVEITIDGVDDVSLSYLNIPALTGLHTIEIDDANNISFTNMSFSDGALGSIHFNTGDNLTISNCTFTDDGWSLYLLHCTNSTIFNNTFTNVTTSIALLTDSSNVTVYNNTLTWIQILSCGQDNLFHHNTIENATDNSTSGYVTWYYDGEGNWWDLYPGVDDDPWDGIGDTPYTVPGDGGNIDLYPLVIMTTRIFTPIPANGSTEIPIDTEYVYVTIKDPEGDKFNFTIEDSEGNSGTYNNQNNGTKQGPYLLTLGNLPYNTTITWWVNLTAGTWPIQPDNKTYTFTTEINQPPVITSALPLNGATGVDINLVNVSVLINDSEGETFDWNIDVSTSDTDSGNDDNNGTKDCTLTTPLAYNTVYTWWVNLSDYTGNTTAQDKSFTFTTRGPNYAPNISSPDPSDDAINNVSLDTGNVTIYIYDPDGDVFSWSIEVSNGDSATGTNEGNGTKSCPLTIPLNDTEVYTWWVNITGGTWDTGYGPVNQTYNFTAGELTESEIFLGRLGDLLGMGILFFVVFLVIFLLYYVIWRR